MSRVEANGLEFDYDSHDLPRPCWPEIVEAIAEIARRADARVPAGAE